VADVYGIHAIAGEQIVKFLKVLSPRHLCGGRQLIVIESHTPRSSRIRLVNRRDRSALRRDRIKSHDRADGHARRVPSWFQKAAGFWRPQSRVRVELFDLHLLARIPQCPAKQSAMILVEHLLGGGRSVQGRGLLFSDVVVRRTVIFAQSSKSLRGHINRCDGAGFHTRVRLAQVSTGISVLGKSKTLRDSTSSRSLACTYSLTFSAVFATSGRNEFGTARNVRSLLRQSTVDVASWPNVEVAAAATAGKYLRTPAWEPRSPEHRCRSLPSSAQRGAVLSLSPGVTFLAMHRREKDIRSGSVNGARSRSIQRHSRWREVNDKKRSMREPGVMRVTKESVRN